MLCLLLSIDNIKQYEFIEVSKRNGLYLIDRKDYSYRIKISSLTLKSTCDHFHYSEEDEKFILYPTNEELYSLSLTATISKTRKRKHELNIPDNETVIKKYVDHIIKYFKDVLKYDVKIDIGHNSNCMHCENDINEIITSIKLPLIELKKVKTNIKGLRSIYKPILLLKNKSEIESIIEKLVVNIYSKLQLYYMHERNRSIYIGFILILTIVSNMNKKVTYQQDFPTAIFDIECNDDDNIDNKLFEKINNCLKTSIDFFISYMISSNILIDDIYIYNIGIKLINNNTIFAGTIAYNIIEFNELSEQEDFKIYNYMKNIPILSENYDTNSSNTIDTIPEISNSSSNDHDACNIYNISLDSKAKKYSVFNDNGKIILDKVMKPIIFSELLLQLANENSIKNFITYCSNINQL